MSENTNQIQDLPEWAQNHIKELRNEAAAARVEKKDAVESAVAAERTKLTAEFNSKVSDLESKVTTLEDAKNRLDGTVLRYEASIAAGVPTESIMAFSKRLVGTTEAELKADAEEAKSMLGVTSRTPAIDPSQGRGDDNAGNGSPSDVFAQFVRDRLQK